MSVVMPTPQPPHQLLGVDSAMMASGELESPPAEPSRRWPGPANATADSDRVRAPQGPNRETYHLVFMVISP
jgi:hypothetical protein